MTGIKNSINKVSRGAIKAFEDYPISMMSALLFSLVTIAKIQMDWEVQQSYSLLLNSLQFSMALSAAVGMASIAYVKSRNNTNNNFLLANIGSLIVGILTFILLYIFSGVESGYLESYMRLSDLAVFRVMASIYTSLVLFIIFAGFPRENPNFSKSMYMTIRAFIVALIYGVVIMAGTSAVAGAIQALLYRDMSYKVYQYLGTISGFLGFAIFLGYFPDLTKNIKDEKRTYVEEQSRFVEVLLGLILVPIALALTIVLLIWTARTSFQGIETSFIQLSGIATSYSLGGILLHLLVTDHKGGLAKFYRSIYPIAALVILGFQLWALIVQVSANGIMDTEYTFGLIWIFSVISVILLLFRKEKSHISISIVSIVLVIVAVLPIIGFHSLPFRVQMSRLERILESEGMLVNEEIVKLQNEPDRSIKEDITEIVLYLGYKDNDNHPSWFSKDLRDENKFVEKFGFNLTWPTSGPDGPTYFGSNLMIPSLPIDISMYDNSILINDFMRKETNEVSYEGIIGEYQFTWTTNRTNEIPKFIVKLNGEEIIQEEFSEYLERLSLKYPPSEVYSKVVEMEDMLYRIETDDLSIMLVFTSIDINTEKNGPVNYWMNLNSIYIKEKN